MNRQIERRMEQINQGIIGVVCLVGLLGGIGIIGLIALAIIEWAWRMVA